MQITIFKDIKETSQPFYRHADIILKRIQEGSSKDLVKKIRAEKNKDNRNILKQKLPAICFSGKFNKRNDNALKQHSGLICLDLFIKYYYFSKFSQYLQNSISGSQKHKNQASKAY